jgi:inward rectifier potassium channel
MAPPPNPPPSPPFQPIILGEPRAFLRDAYHAFLRMRWSLSILVIAAGFMALNFAFALVYFFLGGIANARPGSLLDMLYFSVQTTATIGYGSMYPATDLANVLVMAESAAALIVTALATGLVFAKFSRSTARVRFSQRAVITPVDGVPTLMLRIGNERGNSIVSAQVRAVLSRAELTREGERYYRFHDLQLTRDWAPALSRTWTVMHHIDERSPLHGADAATLAAWDAELVVTVTGIDDITMQQLHAMHSYDYPDLHWQAKLATMLSTRADGAFVVDLRKFHEVDPLPPPSEPS